MVGIDKKKRSKYFIDELQLWREKNQKVSGEKIVLFNLEGMIKSMFMKSNVILEDMDNIYNRGYDWNCFNGKTVLITGAYGMLASYIVYFLMYLNIEKKITVHVIAQGRNPEKARKRFAEFWKHLDFEYINVDILQKIDNISHVDYIVHAAGLANPRYYSTQPVEVIEPNILGTYQLLKLAVQHKSEAFLFFSSGDIYGKAEGVSEITEDTMGAMNPLELHSCYGESKRGGETLCHAYFREYDVRAVIARIGHTYGPTMDIESDPRVFASFIKCALEGKDILLHSDGSARRPFLYIADATAAFMLLLLQGKGGEAYNVTNTKQFLAISELAKIISEIPEQNLNVTYEERNRKDTYLNNSLNHDNKPVEYKLERLGWTAQFTARQGFARVYQGIKQREEQGNENV